MSEVDDPGARPPKRTLAEPLRELGHARIDVSVDLGGLEWSLRAHLRRAPEALPSVDPLSAHGARDGRPIRSPVHYLEAAGLRLFAKGVALQKGHVDSAFVQARWSPLGKLRGGGGDAANAPRRRRARTPAGRRRGRKKWKPKIG